MTCRSPYIYTHTHTHTHTYIYIYMCHTEFNIMQAYERCRMCRLKINHEIFKTGYLNPVLDMTYHLEESHNRFVILKRGIYRNLK